MACLRVDGRAFIMGAGILMFDPDIGVFRNGHVLRGACVILLMSRIRFQGGDRIGLRGSFP